MGNGFILVSVTEKYYIWGHKKWSVTLTVVPQPTPDMRPVVLNMRRGKKKMGRQLILAV